MALGTPIPPEAADYLPLAAAILKGREEHTKVEFEMLDLYPKQAAFVHDPNRFMICEATTKAGKTMACIEKLLWKAIATGEGHFWWVAPVSDQADIAFRRAQDRLKGYIDSSGKKLKIREPIPFKASLNRRIITVNGATIWFKSADKPDSLFGEDVRGAVGDEITRWKEPSWHAVYSTLTATKGWADLIGNVKGKKNFAYRLARKAEGGEPNWGFHRLTADDAIEGGVLDPEIVEQAKRDLPEAVFLELYKAEATEDGSNPFGVSHIREILVEGLSGKPVEVWAWDLAKSLDWTYGAGLDIDGNLAAEHRFQKSWRDTKREIIEITGGLPALIDSTGVGDPILEDLQAEGGMNFEGFKFTGPSKQMLMEGLAVWIQEGRGMIPKGGVLQMELEDFEYEHTRTGVRYSAPEGCHDDTVCGYALAVKHYNEMVGFGGSIDPEEIAV